MAISLESYRIERCDDEQCWTDVRAETGFHTYEEYLNQYCGGEKQLMKYIDNSGTRARCFNGDCRLFEIDETASLSKTLDVRLEGQSVHFTEILLAIRNPSPNALLRVLLIEPKSMEQKLPMGLINVIGLGLRITPDFFKAYLAANHAPHEFSAEVPLRASHGVIGGTAVILARNYLPKSPGCPPLLLILGHPANPDSYKGLLPSAQTGPFAFAQPSTVRPQGLAKYQWPWIFERFFRVNVKIYQVKSLDFDAALVYSLLPILEMCVERLRRAWWEADNEYKIRFGTSSRENMGYQFNIWKNAQEDREQQIEQVRFRLGRWIRHYERCKNDFLRFLRTQGIRDVKSCEAFSVICEEANECLEDARNLELQIRDWLQLRVSSLALQESKKSIQLANLQIEESQRVKIVTILAFVYVPLNLATSIFGMNIQQLNRNGQPIWVFLVTTIVAVWVTSFVWFAIEQRMGYLTWRKEMSAPVDYDSSCYLDHAVTERPPPLGMVLESMAAHTD
ncbi:hypothetical protein G7Y79_00039g075630 [Physcia stellaris]|nr:hypothetical protein G7Y79_00039g075630 [Physcia stellaris]